MYYLINPLSWPFTIIPNLPSNLFEIIDSPIPLLIGVLGNKRVGKSFILSKIFGSPYSPTPIHTYEKLKIKFKQKKSKKKDKNKFELIFIVSDGFNCPILDNNNENEEINININNNEEINEEKEENKNIQSEIIINNCIPIKNYVS